MPQRTRRTDATPIPVMDTNSPPAYTERCWSTRTANGTIDSMTGEFPVDYLNNAIKVACYFEDATGKTVASRSICMRCDETYQALDDTLKTTFSVPYNITIQLTAYIASATTPPEHLPYQLPLMEDPSWYLKEIQGRGERYCRITVRPLSLLPVGSNHGSSGNGQ